MIARRLIVLAFLALAPAVYPAGPANTVRLADGERFIHVVASPFTHSNYAPHFEAMLLRRHASRGLTYRRVHAILAELVGRLDELVFIHRPSIVMIQTGNWDLLRQRHYVFTEYPRHLEEIMAALSARKVRVILCSPIPVGTASTREKPVFPIDQMSGWVDAARRTAAQHDAVFVDLFTESIAWRIPGTGRAQFYPTAEQHRQFFALLQRQVGFEPFGRTVAGDAATRVLSGESTALRDAVWTDSEIGFTLDALSSDEPITLRLAGLAPGTNAVSFNGAPLGIWSAGELARGVALPARAPLADDLPALKVELERGREVAATLSQIHSYASPAWVAVPDFAAQRRAALIDTEARLAEHDARVAALTRATSVTFTVRKFTPIR